MNINNMLYKIISYSFNEIKNRLLFIFFSLFVLRLGNVISIPGVNVYFFDNFINKYSNSFIEIAKFFSSTYLSKASIFLLGIMPYVSSSIIVQLLTYINDYFINLRKDNIYGKYKINNYTKYITLIVSLFQSLYLSLKILSVDGLYNNLLGDKFFFIIISVLSMTSGSMFLMWLSGKITEKGLVNGVSFIIFVDIISRFPNSIYNIFKNVRNYNFYYLNIFLIFLFTFIILYLILMIEMSQRKILIQYASRRSGINMGLNFFNNENTYLPLKINISGIMPSVFTSSIMFFLVILFSWLRSIIKSKYFGVFSFLFYNKNLIYYLIYIFLLVFFCFFYTLLVFNPKDISENLKKTGAYIPSVRPGIYTFNYIKSVLTRLTLLNSIYISIICLFSDFIEEVIGKNFVINGTSLLILVVVIIEFITQIQTLLMSNKYLSILKKINF